MKNFFIFLLMICLGRLQQTSAQSVTSTANGVVNTATTTTKIMKVLTPKLSLSTKQTTNITKLVSAYLLERNGIISLKSSNPDSYNSKFGVINNSFLGKMKTAMTIRQFTKFLGLKPGPTETAAILYILFF
ncbi:hypothetical protein SAMN05444266_110134 [Chitinophaga jiangningensis]|uniref:Uncharacterized protein n=1 Tax=Chitinophaga jiangningensis TaxID=1419482 RepID=A0A1M7L4D5_9BACT|nr:hypothetical protein [Chitinophaga jiangningensis]SHM72893.1 hypothetical protein SAMN05444266_110134 [Chitinophaga jiangningensis]